MSAAFLPASATTTKPGSKPTHTFSGPEKTSTPARVPVPGPRPNVNPNLDSFEAVMKAMDEELSRIRPIVQKSKSKPTPTPSKTTGKGKGKATVEDEDDDIEASMDAELKASLETEDGSDEEDEPMDYNLIKNFLESFKSQAGLSGPVGNLAGRLQPGWNIPRDES